MRESLTSLVSLVSLSRDRRGVTALEYGLIASALAFVLIGIFASLGPPLSAIFSNVGSKL